MRQDVLVWPPSVEAAGSANTPAAANCLRMISQRLMAVSRLRDGQRGSLCAKDKSLCSHFQGDDRLSAADFNANTLIMRGQEAWGWQE